MRVLVYATPKFPVPPEQVAQMVEGSLAWHERWNEHLEAFGSFIGGGGFGIVNVPDERTLNQIVIEMPFSWVSDVNVQPFVDGVDSLHQLQEALAAMAAGG